MDVLIRTRGLSKTIESKLLFDNASFEVMPDNCIGVIGPNGCGKTTLFKILLGLIRPNDGELWFKDNIRVRYLEQTAIRSQNLTAHQFLVQATRTDSIQQQIKSYESQLEDPAIYDSSEYEEILEKIQKLQMSDGRVDDTSRLEDAIDIIEGIGSGKLLLDSKISTLSGGERQKLALASVLAQSQECDLLLLDEPTNHLDINTIEWLERQLVDFPRAIMIISHDRYLLDDLVDRVFEMKNGRIEIFDATYEEYEEQSNLRQHLKYQAYTKTQADIKRRKASIEKMSRRNRFDSQISSKMKRLKKLQHVENPIIKDYLLRFHFKNVFKSGKNIADGGNLSKSFGDTLILNDVSFEILSGQKIGLIGPNGCGKTTLLKMITGAEKPDSGILNISRGARWGYFDQGHLSLNLDNTLIEEILRDQNDLKETDAKALLGQFNFRGTIVYNQTGKLSGGERARLAFLRLIMQPYNFLILDEPTNHMDLESKMAIEGALNSFSGTVIVVSHDRRFLDNVIDTTFLMTNTSIITYKGNYSASRLQHQKELLKTPGAKLNDMPGGNLKKYVVKKSFTDWTTRRKYKIGEEILIGDHNFELYEWAINSSRLKCLRRNK